MSSPNRIPSRVRCRISMFAAALPHGPVADAERHRLGAVRAHRDPPLRPALAQDDAVGQIVGIQRDDVVTGPVRQLDGEPSVGVGLICAHLVAAGRSRR
ncbi:MAG: hypothetical protein WKF47_10520 [Geodermatophilaceae bacterium]